jgi:hypothetical protein
MNRNWLSVGIVAVLLAAACDPYTEAPGGPASIVSVLTTSGNAGLTATEGVASGGAWVVPPPSTDPTVGVGVPSTCTTADGTLADESIIWVVMNKQINPASVQATTADCTPAGNWLTVTPAAPAGSAWYSCYIPSAPSASEGGSIAIFLAPAATPATGQGEAEPLPGAANATTAYRVTGNVKDNTGANVPLDATITIAPDPGDTGVFASSAISAPGAVGTPGSVDLGWTAPACASETNIRVLRSPHGAGTFTAIAPTLAPGTATYTDNGVVVGSAYDYHLETQITVGAATFTEQKGAVSYGIVAPITAAPTCSGATATSVTVTWTPVVGASDYNVLRGTTASPTAAYAIGVTGTSWVDTTVVAGRTYYYRVVPRAGGVTNRTTSNAVSAACPIPAT